MIMTISLDEFQKGMERLDVRDFRTKKIWHGFEYYKTDRKAGVKTSLIMGYSDYGDCFTIETLFASLRFKSIEAEKCPILNKYHLICGETQTTLNQSFLTKMGDCPLKISQPEHIEMLVDKVQRVLDEEMFPFVEKYSNMENIAKEIASKNLDELPFNFAYACPQATAMLFLKQTNSPVYKDKLQETAEGLKQYVDGDVKERGLELAEGSIDVLKMFEELLHDDLETVGYDFHHDF